VTIRHRLYLLQALPLLVPLTGLIRDVFSELYSKHALNLLDRSIAAYIYMAGDNLINLNMKNNARTRSMDFTSL
jgi:hypothetical protein